MASEEAREEFRAKFRLAETTIHVGEHWVVSARPGQPVPGSLVVSTNHPAVSFGDLPSDAGPELLAVFAAIEATARSHLGAARINVLCLMMVDPLVHFHVLPRYGSPVDFAGRTWVDRGWPGPPDLAAEPASSADLQAVASVYRPAFGD